MHLRGLEKQKEPDAAPLLTSNKPRELVKIFPLLFVGSFILTRAEKTHSLSQGVDELCRPNYARMEKQSVFNCCVKKRRAGW